MPNDDDRTKAYLWCRLREGPMGAARAAGIGCDFEGTMSLLGERHVLQLLYLLVEKSPRGFTELKLQAVVNTATLTDRLKRLEGLGIIERTVIRALPRRVEYDITPMGQDLVQQIFRTMAEWRSKYSSGGGGAGAARRLFA